MCNMYDEKNYINYIKALKLTLDYGLILENFHRVIEYNQEASFHFIYLFIYLSIYLFICLFISTLHKVLMLVSSIFANTLHSVSFISVIVAEIHFRYWQGTKSEVFNYGFLQ